MQYGSLSAHFTGIAAKKLSVVEADTARSNQHEFNGTSGIRKLLGSEPFRERPARFIWLGGENEGITDDAPVTWYDSRLNQLRRSPEWRLYFRANAVMETASTGDLLVVGRRPLGDLLFIVAPRDSTLENQIAWLFGLDGGLGAEFRYEGFDGGNDRGLDFISNYVLEEIGIEPEEPEVDLIDALIAPFDRTFPTSRVFSAVARAALPDVDPLTDPDAALLSWIELEEAMFRRLERHLVAERLASGFYGDGEADVDGFLDFSLRVQNRRKSRMGLSLENHVEEILKGAGVQYERGRRTEGSSKPDFLFPNATAYRDATFDPARLTMLGLKSTSKDRWRQVLAEAARIERKHLLTLEPGISTGQTNEMIRHSLQLVVPTGLHRTFTPAQAGWLMSVDAFLHAVLARQHAAK